MGAPGRSAARRCRRRGALGGAASDHAERDHRLGDAPEAHDLGADAVVARTAELLRRLEAGAVDAGHDLVQPLLAVLEGPGVAAGVLLHLERRGRDAAGVGGLARAERDARFLEHADPARRGRHVRAFRHRDAAVGDQPPRRGFVELVLRRARQRDLARNVPDVAAFDVLRVAVGRCVVADAPALDLLQLLDQLEVQALRMVDHAVRVRAGDDARAQRLQLLDRVDRDVARSRDDAGLALDRSAARREHLLGEEDRTVAGGLLANQRAAPLRALAGDHSRLVAVGDALVLPEEVADLARADADVAGRNVGELAQVSVELGHEALAEAHHLGVAAALRVEVRAALGAADRHAGDRVLEDLLEAEELDDPQVHRRVEAQPALVGPERAVELDAEAAVDLHLAAVVLPGHAKDDLTLGLADAFDDLLLGVFGMLAQHRAEGVDHFLDRLVELGLPGVALDDLGVEALDARFDFWHGSAFGSAD